MTFESNTGAQGQALRRAGIIALGLTLTLAGIVIATAAPAAPSAARWCSVFNPGLGDVQWDCRFPTLATCAAAVGTSSRACLENPDWHLPRPRPTARWSR